MKNINESYEKMNKETTKLFELKHEKLIKEEKEIKDKLDNEVTKIKSKLEEYFSLANTLIKNYEKINKVIKTLNKNQEEMNKIFKILMKSLKLDFIDDNIKYEEFFLMAYQYLKIYKLII